VEEIFPVWLNTSSNGADVAGMKAAHNTTVELTCIDQNDEGYYPVWYMNGSADGYRSSRDEDHLGSKDTVL